MRRVAAILSRVRSAMISLSNCANDNSTLSTIRPIEVAVLTCWVMLMKETPRASNASIMREKSSSERLKRSTL